MLGCTNNLPMLKAIINAYIFLSERILKLSKPIVLITSFSIIILGISPILISYVFKLIAPNLEISIGGNKLEKTLLSLCQIYVLLTVVKEIVLIFRSTTYSIASRIFLFDMQNIILEKFKKIDFKVFFTQKFHDLYIVFFRTFRKLPWNTVHKPDI